jgi:hypothetical protein
MGMRSITAPRVAAGLGVSAVLVGGLVAFSVGGGERSSQRAVGADTSAEAAPGTPARFGYLARQHSNRCALQAEELLRRHGSEHLQGSCCSPMDEHAYVEQVRALRRHRQIGEIPRDPYDIPVALAKRLLLYQAAIRLSPRERSLYRRGMEMSREKGPCCCRCWRWTAFEGLSKYLIARHGWQPRRLARLIEALDGCGGGHRHGAGHAGRAPPSA